MVILPRGSDLNRAVLLGTDILPDNDNRINDCILINSSIIPIVSALSVSNCTSMGVGRGRLANRFDSYNHEAGISPLAVRMASICTDLCSPDFGRITIIDGVDPATRPWFLFDVKYHIAHLPTQYGCHLEYNRYIPTYIVTNFDIWFEVHHNLESYIIKSASINLSTADRERLIKFLTD